MWESLLKQVEWIDNASFYFVDGKFVGNDFTVFEGTVGFRGLARMKSGAWEGLTGKQTITWRRRGEDWKITAWKMKAMTRLESPGPLFEESLARALPDSAEAADKAIAAIEAWNRSL